MLFSVRNQKASHTQTIRAIIYGGFVQVQVAVVVETYSKLDRLSGPHAVLLKSLSETRTATPSFERAIVAQRIEASLLKTRVDLHFSVRGLAKHEPGIRVDARYIGRVSYVLRPVSCFLIYVHVFVATESPVDWRIQDERIPRSEAAWRWRRGRWRWRRG